MSDDRPQSSRPRTEEPTRRGFASAFTVELVVGVGTALGLFLLLLWLLDLGLPTGEGLGELVRAPQDARSGETRLGFDAPDGGLVAVLTDVRRDVRDKPASSVVWSTARAGTPLGDRHAVQSYGDSGASIRFGENQWLELGENSVIVLRKPRRVDGSLRRRASVLFMDGFLRSRVEPGGSGATELEFIAAGGTIRASAEGGQPADIELSVENDHSAVSVLAGTAEIVWGDEVTQVSSGQMVTYETGQSPGQPEPLPLPPRLLEPGDGARYRYRQVPPMVSFAWQLTDDGEEFRLQIARDADFDRIVYDESLTASSFIHGNLGAGDYHWRVFHQRGPVSSPPTPTRQLIVERHDVAPPLTLELPEGTVRRDRILIRGTTRPECQVLIGDLAVAVAADGRFEHELTLQHGYNFLVVQSIDPTGNAAFRNHTILADLASPERAP